MVLLVEVLTRESPVFLWPPQRHCHSQRTDQDVVGAHPKMPFVDNNGAKAHTGESVRSVVGHEETLKASCIQVFQ